MKPGDVADGQLCLVRRTSGDTGPAYRRSEVFQQKDVSACLGVNVAIVTGRSWQHCQARDLLIGTDFSFISNIVPGRLRISSVVEGNFAIIDCGAAELCRLSRRLSLESCP